MKISKRPKIGDLVEIRIDKLFAYAQYTHKHKIYGALLRIFDEMYGERPQSFQNLISGKVRFSTFFPLQAALSEGIFEVVGNIPIRKDLREFPVFRSGVTNPETKKVDIWWLWDGEKEWKVGKLDEKQRKFPIRGVWNDTLLIQRIKSGWTPETDPAT